MLDIKFPANVGQQRYSSYHIFWLNLFKFAGCNVELYEPITTGTIIDGGITCLINGKTVYINHREDPWEKPIQEFYSEFKYIFTMHTPVEIESKYNNVYPVSPLSFRDWGRYYELRKQINYQAKGLVLNRQRPYANARHRRREAQKRLKIAFDGLVRTSFIEQEQFWLEANNAICFVDIPGQRIDILDFSQLQFMAFGVCTVSPPILARLPYGLEMKPGEHYVVCKPTLDNLVTKVAWCQNHPGEAQRIGRRAQKVFDSCCIPEKQVAWIQNIIAQ